MDSAKDPLITLREAMRFLDSEYGMKVCRQTLKRWALDGKKGIHLDAGPWPTQWKTRPSAIRAFMEATKPKSSVEPEPIRLVKPVDLRKAEAARRSWYGED